MIDPRLQIREELEDSAAVGSRVYADEAAELRALTEGAGLYARLDRVWHVTGSDAVNYLHRMLTQDVEGIEVPGGRRACLLNRQGRVLGDFLVWRPSDGCFLDLAMGTYEEALPVLEKFVIADDVTFEEVSETFVRFALMGPRAPDVLADAAIEVPARNRCVSIGAAEQRFHVLCVPHGDGTRFEFLAARAGVGIVLDALFGQDVVPVGVRAFEHERIRVRDPGHGELDERILFNESQLDDAVSWDKGCYPGQEPVIMARHRGRPPNLLVGLRGDGRCPPIDSQLLAQGRQVGRITSLAPDGADAWIGLGYVRTAFAEDPQPMQQPEGTCLLRG